MNNSDLAILGLILEMPRHGYEIEQVIQERGMRNWTEIGFSSIYYVLGRLERHGYINPQREPAEGRGPDRKVYSITKAGRAAWKEATLAALAEPAHTGSPFLLGLAGLPGLSTPDVLDALASYQAELEDRLEELREQRRQLGSNPPLFLTAMFEYSEALAGAERSWLAGFFERLADRAR